MVPASFSVDLWEIDTVELFLVKLVQQMLLWYPSIPMHLVLELADSHPPVECHPQPIVV